VALALTNYAVTEINTNFTKLKLTNFNNYFVAYLTKSLGVWWLKSLFWF